MSGRHTESIRLRAALEQAQAALDLLLARPD